MPSNSGSKFWSTLLAGGYQSRRDGKPPLTFRERVNALRNLPEFFRMIWQTSRSMTLLNLALRLVRAAVPAVSLYIGKLIINEVLHLIQMPGGERSFSHLWMLVGLEFGVALVSDVFGRSIALLDSLLGDLFSNHTSIRLIEHAATLDLYHFEDSSFYDKLDRARQQTTARTTLMTQVLSQVQDVISMIFLAVALIAFSPWLILLLIIALVPAFLGESHFNAKTYSFMRKWTPERRELDMLRYTGASDETAKEVKVFDLSAFLTGRFRDLSDRFYRTNRSIALKRFAWGSSLAMIGRAGYYGAYIVILVRTVGGQITIGDLTFLAGSFSKLQSLLQDILMRFSSMADSALYLGDLFEFFALRPRVQAPPRPKSFPKPIREGVTFEDVGFVYPNSDRWTLRHLNFTLRAGEKLALVGENGAGKTTIVKLLARLYDPAEGRILLDGYDIREYDPDDLRHEIGIIFQDFVQYDMTASENIAIGRIEAINDRERIKDAAERSLARSVIETLPKGFDQILGKRFANGVDLSVGEWQKVALARAYMRDAQLLILDEPTASLDARAEHQVFERFAELTRDKSAILISHRFSTVRMADRIVVLDRGEILEMGTHAELLSRNGRYAELFNLQAQGYR